MAFSPPPVPAQAQTHRTRSPCQPSAAADASKVYIVQLAGAPVATYTGSVRGLPRHAGRRAPASTAGSPAVQAYRGHLDTQRNAVLARLGGGVNVVHTYGTHLQRLRRAADRSRRRRADDATPTSVSVSALRMRQPRHHAHARHARRRPPRRRSGRSSTRSRATSRARTSSSPHLTPASGRIRASATSRTAASRWPTTFPARRSTARRRPSGRASARPARASRAAMCNNKVLGARLLRGRLPGLRARSARTTASTCRRAT